MLKLAEGHQQFAIRSSLPIGYKGATSDLDLPSFLAGKEQSDLAGFWIEISLPLDIH